MTKQDIGLRIRMIRDNLGMRQREFAKLLHLSNASVSGYELGDSYPKLDTLMKIAEIGNVSIVWLIMGGDQVGLTGQQLSKDDIRLLKAFHQAGEKDRRVILRVAESLGGVAEGKKTG